jgi:glucosamine-6-phosphate deaminase
VYERRYGDLTVRVAETNASLGEAAADHFAATVRAALQDKEEVARYTRLLDELEPAICVMGIGENGHLAFNDPPARFDTEESVHVVRLDMECRAQQVGEGHFPSLAETPESALSLTVPALLRPATVLVLAPEQRKAAAVRAALEGPVTEDCPASILTTVGHATLYLDAESASELSEVAVPQTT